MTFTISLKQADESYEVFKKISQLTPAQIQLIAESLVHVHPDIAELMQSSIRDEFRAITIEQMEI